MLSRKIWGTLVVMCTATTMASIPASAQQQQQAQGQKPNILFIMGDDIGWMQPRIYHEGIGLGETPNIDRIGQEGAKFMDYLAMQSCTSGRNASPACIHCVPA
jgi:arylsulfatase